ncbi:hypothetical protein APUTEX25_003093 [Auxenochlorella protothecoides]|uniref:Exocyst complex component EXOC6/Sec15 N-terminal domain-containing protein n=1 Tax=Auxenochlorella protothecoides TaxID=3075 RepID=A0A3M7KY98_AUXPR|nr:hypothetical protein APUTEX25_003093 [Auxenochlorella protothecoides]|eukprot:RMZ54715.1 hypothetical protein APUTEX25_003093 [Auxenochlorella protothecoides]
MAANGLGRHGLMDAIDQALDSGDTSHLVRLVFATDPSRFLPAPSGPDTDTVTTSLGDDDGFPGGNVLESVLEALQEVSEDREMEIQDICSRHGMEIATALAQLGPLQGDLKDLKRAVQANNSQYQALGSQYLTLHDSLLSWQGTMARLASLQSLTDRLVAGWSLCLHAVQAEAGGKLYRAYCLLGEVPTGSATAAESALSSQAAALRQGIVTAVQSSINSWLARRLAPRVGAQAIHDAADACVAQLDTATLCHLAAVYSLRGQSQALAQYFWDNRRQQLEADIAALQPGAGPDAVEHAAALLHATMGHLLIDAAAARACSELRPGKGQDSGRQLAQNMLSSLAGVLCHDPGVGITELEALRDLLCLARGALGPEGRGVVEPVLASLLSSLGERIVAAAGAEVRASMVGPAAGSAFQLSEPADAEAHSLALRTLPESIAGRVLAAYLGMVSESLLRALGAAPAINMFGMLRLLSDVGGLRAVVERAGADPEPLAPVCLFAEALVFGRLGPQGVPGIQAPRLLQLLERYREVPRSSGLAGQHSTPSAGKGSPERFLSKKSVEDVMKALRSPTKRAK